jgi:hypothetical protein
MLSEPLKAVSVATPDGFFQLLMRLAASLQALTGSRRKLPWRHHWPDALRDEEELNLGVQGNGGKPSKASTAGGATGKRRGRPPKAAPAADTGQIGLAL